MRFALKVVPLAALGCAAALLVACGDGNGLLSDSQAESLQDALVAAQSACADGEAARAELAAQRFAGRVAALPPGSVDERLIANLEQGAATLATLVSGSCTATTETTTTPTVTTTTTPTTTTPTVTTTTTPTTAAPTTPTAPPTTPTAPVVPPDDDDGPGNGGGSPGGGNPPPGPEGNPGGASPGFPGGGDD